MITKNGFWLNSLILEQTNKIRERMENKEEKAGTGENVGIEKSVEKEMVTHYFELDLIDDIADFIHQFRKQLPLNKRKKLNRSLILKVVMTEVMKEYKTFGNDSFLSKHFDKWKNE
jgi:hypothetical protein